MVHFRSVLLSREQQAHARHMRPTEEGASGMSGDHGGHELSAAKRSLADRSGALRVEPCDRSRVHETRTTCLRELVQCELWCEL